MTCKLIEILKCARKNLTIIIIIIIIIITILLNEDVFDLLIRTHTYAINSQPWWTYTPTYPTRLI